MVFWGAVVGTKHCTVEIPEGGSIYLLQVCAANLSSPLASLYVKPSNEKKAFLICHVGSLQPQFSLCHELVAEDSPIEFWTTGGDLHITGTTQSEETGDDDDEDDSQEEEEEPMYAEECAPTTKPVKSAPEKRSRADSVDVAEPVKKSKADAAVAIAAVAAIPADVVILQTHQQRKKWKIKPQNDEGVLVLDPKSLKKASGVAVTDYIIGKGAEPKLGAKVKITYVGSFPDGTVFDQRITRAKPFSFRKGTAQVIRGLDFGLEGMRIGGSREIVIPPELGYGKEGVDKIPGNQTLIFRVSLVGQEKKKL